MVTSKASIYDFSKVVGHTLGHQEKDVIWVPRTVLGPADTGDYVMDHVPDISDLTEGEDYFIIDCWAPQREVSKRTFTEHGQIVYDVYTIQVACDIYPLAELPDYEKIKQTRQEKNWINIDDIFIFDMYNTADKSLAYLVKNILNDCPFSNMYRVHAIKLGIHDVRQMGQEAFS